MMLYHFSERQDIDIFYPRQLSHRTELPPLVWAIDEEHEFSFFFPRACPRIVLYKTDTISDEHHNMFFNGITADKLVFIEHDWFSKIDNTKLYRYQFDDPNFVLFDKTAGYYTSTNTIVPVAMDSYDKLIERLYNKGVNLVLQQSLHPLRQAIINSGFQDFGIHQFKNAKK